MGCVISDQTKNNQALSSLDHYQKQHLIGVGHHGRVYKCFYHLDKNQYALKIIQQSAQHNNATNLQLLSTAFISKLKKLRHKNLVTYYQIHFSQHQISVVMDLAKQGTLQTYIIKNGALPQSKIAHLAQKILRGLEYLHGAGVLHKDLKSSNVLMISKAQIKLSDYGLAEIYDPRLVVSQKRQQENISFLRRQTLPYIAPQVIKYIDVSNKSDVWSLGCIIIEMLTSRVPWFEGGRPFQQVLAKICEGVYPPFPSNISCECQSFLQSCLAVIPSQRLNVKQLLQHKFISMHCHSQKLLEEDSIQSIHLNIQHTEVNPSIIKFQQNNSSSYLTKQQPNNQQNKHFQHFVPAKTAKFIKQKQQPVDKVQASIGHQINNTNAQNLYRQQDLQKINGLKDRTVMLNNRQVKLQPNLYMKNFQNNQATTQETQWTTPPRYARNSSQLADTYDMLKNIPSRNRIKSTNVPHVNDSIDNQLHIHHLRMQTQPQATHEHQHNIYFKKPLKLLKQKIKQNKMLADFNTKLSNQSRLDEGILTEIQSHQKSVFDDVEEQMRSRNEARREQIIIDTALARAERDRYMTEQRLLKKQREVQKRKWEWQLKKGAEILNRQLPHRYYYEKNRVGIF